MNKNTKIATLGIIGISGFYLYFNRSPCRQIQEGIISPADGTIEKIENDRIDIFIGLTDVHVQRAPISGYIYDVQDYPDENRNVILIDNLIIERKGGILARSVITDVKVNEYVEKGQIIGKIKLGSHTSIYPIYNPLVSVGEHIIAGQTIGYW